MFPFFLYTLLRAVSIVCYTLNFLLPILFLLIDFLLRIDGYLSYFLFLAVYFVSKRVYLFFLGGYT